jgi:dTDP-4-amino-4,6-dideoxygalactose transaminase
MIMIPLVDLKAAHAEVADEVARGFQRIMDNTAFIGGGEITAFENEYAAASGVEHCIAVANGTDAVELALRAVGVGPGDEVIVPTNTYVASVEAVCRAGAKPVLVDIDPVTYLVDVEAMVAAVTDATKAVVPVHLYGQHAPVEQLRAALSGRAVSIVEDAAQCQGARRHGVAAGAGGIAATSFYPGKNLGAYGDAGAVVTSDPDLALAVRKLGNHGGLGKYEHDVIGFNSRLDPLQAVVLRAKLARLSGWNAARRCAAQRYDALLAPLEVVRPVALDGNVHVWHLYVIRVPGDGTSARRDRVFDEMTAAGIGVGLHYPKPVHLTGAFAHLGHGPGTHPGAERAATEILSLPMHPHITPEQQEQVVEALAEALKNL